MYTRKWIILLCCLLSLSCCKVVKSTQPSTATSTHQAEDVSATAVQTPSIAESQTSELGTATEVAITKTPPPQDHIPLIAFTFIENGNRSVNTIRPDGTDLLRLTDGDSNNFKPKWSPDGDSIAFISDREDPAGQLFVMNADGSGAKRITDISGVYPFDWSPDSRTLVFASKEPNSDDDYVIYKIAIDHTEPIPLFNCPELVTDLLWSPLGNSILVKAGDRPTRDAILILDVYYRDVKHLRKSFTRGVFGIDWHPDGMKIAYDGVYDWESERDLINVINADGTGDRPLTEASHSAGYPEWSPRGDKLAYVCFFDKEPPGICVLDLNNNRTFQVSPEGFSANSPSWSRDGSAITFNVETENMEEKGYSLYVYFLDKGYLSEIVNEYVDGYPADWRP
jgi:Tol biopolymer transport system component